MEPICNFFIEGENIDGEYIQFEYIGSLEGAREACIKMLNAYDGGHLDIFDGPGDKFIDDVEV